MTSEFDISPRILLESFRRSWSIESSTLWSPGNPARGQCGVTALVACDLLGGEILKTKVGDAWYFYNRIEGEIVDFTVEQFETPITYQDLPANRDEVLRDASNEQYVSLLERVKSDLAGDKNNMRYHMSLEEFRRHGHDLVEWIADYLESIESHPIRSKVKPGEIRSRLPALPPDHPQPFSDILRDLDEIVLPGITHWQSPGWFAYFPANSSPASILGELVAAGLGVQGMLWSTSPACTEIESHVLDWLVDLLGVPESWKLSVGPGGGVLQMSGSDSTHTALVVARHHRATEAGSPIEKLVAYTSKQSHSSVEKGARIAGFSHLRAIDVDRHLAMDPASLDRAIAQDLAMGLVPAVVISTIGSTGTNAIDPIEAIGAISSTRGLWHHVDAAYAGTAMICPELRSYQRGLKAVDSYAWNPHKWMFTNFDCSVFWVADREPLLATMRISPPYLKNAASDSGAVIDYRDWHVPLGRRFRALKLWFVLRTYGSQGLRFHIREHLRLARQLADRITDHPRLELVAPTPFALVSFRHVDGDPATLALAETINNSDKAYITPSKLPNGSDYIRVSIGQTWTEQKHLDYLWRLIQNAV